MTHNPTMPGFRFVEKFKTAAEYAEWYNASADLDEEQLARTPRQLMQDHIAAGTVTFFTATGNEFFYVFEQD